MKNGRKSLCWLYGVSSLLCWKDWFSSIDFSFCHSPDELDSIDFICGLPETLNGFTVGLIIIDCVTCFVFLHPLKSKSLEAVAEVLLEVFCNFGFPWEIQSDQDPSFMSKSMNKFKELTEAHSRKVLKYFPA